jgi:hypothetical protein
MQKNGSSSRVKVNFRKYIKERFFPRESNIVVFFAKSKNNANFYLSENVKLFKFVASSS